MNEGKYMGVQQLETIDNLSGIGAATEMIF